MKDHPTIEKLERDGDLNWKPCWKCGEPAEKSLCEDCYKEYLKKAFSIGLGKEFIESAKLEHDFYIQFLHEVESEESISLTEVCKEHFNTLKAKDQHTQLREFIFTDGIYEIYKNWRKENE